MNEEIIKTLMIDANLSRQDALKCRMSYLKSEVKNYDPECLKACIDSMNNEIDEITAELTIKIVRFVGIDDWNRPVFKDIDSDNYYGSVDKLFSYCDTEIDALNRVSEQDLCYFGTSFGCEPMGSSVNNIFIEWSKEIMNEMAS